MNWIPCKKRLPELNGYKNQSSAYVLISFEDDVTIACLRVKYLKEDEVWWASEEDGGWELEKVNAWMPLPEPYKGE